MCLCGMSGVQSVFIVLGSSPIIAINLHYCSLKPFKGCHVLMREAQFIMDVGRDSVLYYLAQ